MFGEYSSKYCFHKHKDKLDQFLVMYSRHLEAMEQISDKVYLTEFSDPIDMFESPFKKRRTTKTECYERCADRSSRSETEDNLRLMAREKYAKEQIERLNKALRKRNTPIDEFKNSLKTLLICPISLELIKDPVVATTGITYEKSNISQWIERHGKDLISKKAICEDDLVPDIAVRNIIEAVENID
ncbi:unnamed protein product [Moneuplotes crassus]|uniref:RING-type E3 ubiquitin transferase n=1 Tax=Euplotes crassus TaxID=5936 RepID=A0AAD2D2I7_EUPCR|nr:unnamed protein product [Moneuplotes crassus]